MSSNASVASRRRIAGSALVLSLLATPSLAIAASATTVTVPTPAPSSEANLGTSLSRIEKVPFRTVIVEDADLPADVEVVASEGSDGVRHIYTTAGYSESAIPTYRSVTVQEPVDRVIHRGVTDALPTVAEPEPEPEPEPTPEVASRTTERAESAAGTSVSETGGSDSADYAAPTVSTSGEYSLGDLMFMGVVNWGGYKFTYYSQGVLPGGGLSIPGRHVNGGGFVADGDGYIVLAAPYGISHGTVFSTPFGAAGKVYDTCATCSTSPMWLDVYTR